MYGPVWRVVPARPGSIVGRRQTIVFAQDQLERAVFDMRAQFLMVSGQIADELTRLAQHAATSSPGVRERVIMAAAQIASTQQFLRAESDRLPSDPQERYAIMESVLQAQQGALHQLAIIVKQHAPGWYPNLSQTAAWYPSVPNAAAWPSSLPVASEGEPNAPSAAAWYPSPPTVQELAGQNWPSANGNGYAVDMQPRSAQSVWPTGTAGAMVPYVNGGNGYYSEAPVPGPWPGRRSYALVPAQQVAREFRPARSHASHGGQVLATARRQAELVDHGAGSRNLFWIGVFLAGLVFAYLSFPLEIRHKDAVAKQTKTAMQDADEKAAVAVEPPSRPRVVASPPPAPVLIARAEEEAPPPPAPASPGMILPGGLLAGSPNVAIGTLGPGQAGAPPIAREPPVETAAAPAEPAARTKQRTAPSRVEPETPAPAAAAPHLERFVPVLFTHQDGPTATQAFAELQQQYPALLANRQGETQAVDLGKKGVWHRLVVLPAGSRQDAADLCGQLSGAGYGKCWVKAY